jgi:hypothetical protein
MAGDILFFKTRYKNATKEADDEWYGDNKRDVKTEV